MTSEKWEVRAVTDGRIPKNVTDGQPQPYVSLKLLPFTMIDFQLLNKQTLQYNTHKLIVLLATQFYKENSCHSFKSFIIL
jgi:hypothetical protein